MSRANVRADIHRAIVGEVLDALEKADAPLSMADLKKRCPTAADLDDLRPAVHELLQGENIVRFEGQGMSRYQLPGKAAALAKPKRKKKPGRAGPADKVVAELETAQAWLTIEELELRVRGLSNEQFKTALKCKRIQRRPRVDGSVYEYGLAEWNTPAAEPEARSQPATRCGVYASVKPTTRPNGRADRVVDAIQSAENWLTLDELDQSLEDARNLIGQTLSGLAGAAGSGRLVSRHRSGSDRKEYGLPEWAPSTARPVERADYTSIEEQIETAHAAIVALLVERDAWQTFEHIDEALPHARQAINKALEHACEAGHLVTVTRPRDAETLFGLPDWATPLVDGEATGTAEQFHSIRRAFDEIYGRNGKPGTDGIRLPINFPGGLFKPDTTEPDQSDPREIDTRRFALWSDGQLSVDDASGRIELSQPTVTALLTYLAEVTPGTLRRALESQEAS